MGCCSPSKSGITNESENADANNAIKEELSLKLDADVTTDTYDPANMSMSHNSEMKDYHFTTNRKKLTPIEELNKRISAKDMQTILTSDASKISDNSQQYTVPQPRKRCVFVSIAQLNAGIDSIPSYILSESIFCFKASKRWFFPRNSMDQKASKFSIRRTMNFTDKFLAILKEKHEQNLILWMEEGKTWNDISKQLTEIEDIYYAKKESSSESGPTYYQPLNLSVAWWRDQFTKDRKGVKPMYCSSADSMVDEVVFHRLKFNPAMELFYQSNPTLIPMRNFDMELYIKHHFNVNDDYDDDNENGDENKDIDGNDNEIQNVQSDKNGKYERNEDEKEESNEIKAESPRSRSPSIKMELVNGLSTVVPITPFPSGHSAMSSSPSIEIPKELLKDSGDSNEN